MSQPPPTPTATAPSGRRRAPVIRLPLGVALQRTVLASLAAAILLFGVLTAQMAVGNDPGLSAAAQPGDVRRSTDLVSSPVPASTESEEPDDDEAPALVPAPAPQPVPAPAPVQTSTS
jgi:hypothetical protein